VRMNTDKLTFHVMGPHNRHPIFEACRRMPNGQDFLSERFLSHAKAVASRNGYTFAVNCENDLRTMIQTGITQLRLSPTAELSDRTQVVENNLELLVLEMIRALPKGQTELQEFTLINAKLKLCPLYPFC
jgi:hypothetical protein